METVVVSAKVARTNGHDQRRVVYGAPGDFEKGDKVFVEKVTNGMEKNAIPKSELAGRPRLMSNAGNTPIKNTHLRAVTEDHLYHLGMSTNSTNFKEQFGDVQFVCVGGTASRMNTLAEQIYEMMYQCSPKKPLIDYARAGGRYSVYKVGPVLCLNHNIGASPLGVVLHEIFKLLHYADIKSEHVTMFRIGTSGGLGYDAGTVVITDKVIDAAKRNHFHSVECGVIRPLPCRIDQDLAAEVKAAADRISCPSVVGGTMGTDDFYLGQGRVDGAFCDYGESDKKRFLQELYEEYGIVNMEMEAHILSAFTYRAGIRCSIVCTTIINRLHGDQIQYTHEELAEFEQRPLNVVIEFIRSKLM